MERTPHLCSQLLTELWMYCQGHQSVNLHSCLFHVRLFKADIHSNVNVKLRSQSCWDGEIIYLHIISAELQFLLFKKELSLFSYIIQLLIGQTTCSTLYHLLSS